MELFPPEIRARLLARGEIRRAAIENPGDKSAFHRAMELHPIVKIYMTVPRRVWLLTDIDPILPDYAFGLADLGTGKPIVNFVNVSAFAYARQQLGLSIFRDPDFKPAKSLREYAVDAHLRGRLDDDSAPACAAGFTPATEETLQPLFSHVIDAQDDAERTSELEQSRGRLDEFLRRCDEENKRSDSD